MASKRSLHGSVCGLALATALLTGLASGAPPPGAAGTPAAAATPAPAAAGPLGPERTRMTLVMEDYFAGEEAQAGVFLGAGLAAFGTGAFLLTRGDEMAEGAAYPVLAIGVLQAAVGVGLLARTGAQVSQRRARIAADPVAFKHAEEARLSGVMTRFAIVEYIEIAFAAAGLGLVAHGEADRQPRVTGIGAGLALQSTLMLGLDFLADRRAGRYQRALAGFNPCISREGLGLLWQAAF